MNAICGGLPDGRLREGPLARSSRRCATWGHTFTVEEDARAAVRLERCWRPGNVPRAPTASDDAYAEELPDLFARAVKDRLRGSGPVGTHLSAGGFRRGVPGACPIRDGFGIE